MKVKQIKTYSTIDYRQVNIKADVNVAKILKSGFENFFIVRVEQMIRLMKLPVPPARTSSPTIIFLTSGSGTITIGSSTHRFRKQECIVVPAGQVFSFDKIEANKGYLINFNPEFIVTRFLKPGLLSEFEFLEVWGNPHLRLSPGVALHIRRICERLFKEYSDQFSCDFNLIRAYLLALLFELKPLHQPTTSAHGPHVVGIANKFKSLVVANFRSKQKPAEYAALLHITPNYLSKVVRDVIGKTPSIFIQEMIILESKVLLYQADMSINAVSSQIGISDASYFSRLFKKHTGMTPVQFRKKM